MLRDSQSKQATSYGSVLLQTSTNSHSKACHAGSHPNSLSSLPPLPKPHRRSGPERKIAQGKSPGGITLPPWPVPAPLRGALRPRAPPARLSPSQVAVLPRKEPRGSRPAGRAPKRGDLPVDGGDAGDGVVVADALGQEPVSDLPGEHGGVLPFVLGDFIHDFRGRHLRLRAADHARFDAACLVIPAWGERRAEPGSAALLPSQPLGPRRSPASTSPPARFSCPGHDSKTGLPPPAFAPGHSRLARAGQSLRRGPRG